jgi:hypothetical protein
MFPSWKAEKPAGERGDSSLFKSLSAHRGAMGSPLSNLSFADEKLRPFAFARKDIMRYALRTGYVSLSAKYWTSGDVNPRAFLSIVL